MTQHESRHWNSETKPSDLPTPPTSRPFRTMCRGCRALSSRARAEQLSLRALAAPPPLCERGCAARHRVARPASASVPPSASAVGLPVPARGLRPPPQLPLALPRPCAVGMPEQLPHPERDHDAAGAGDAPADSPAHVTPRVVDGPPPTAHEEPNASVDVGAEPDACQREHARGAGAEPGGTEDALRAEDGGMHARGEDVASSDDLDADALLWPDVADGDVSEGTAARHNGFDAQRDPSMAIDKNEAHHL
jgi:hypothetical protein